METDNFLQLNELQYLRELKSSGEIHRLGALFNTAMSNYFYDTGTGQVFKLKDEIYNMLNILFSRKSCEEDFVIAAKKTPNDLLENFLSVSITHNLFRAPEVNNLILSKNPVQQIRRQFEQLVLEVTEKCNFRCKYCIYSEDYSGNRNFGTKNMEENVAFSAIDYAFEHADKDLAVSFYGGEPLENLRLIKSSINYANEKNKKYNKKLSYSLTTNLSLVTKEIADYLSNVPGISLVLSIDGPEEVQNSGRVYAGGKGTFADVMQGLNYIADAFKNTNKPLAINAVLIPPYSFEKLDCMNAFFESLSILSETIPITVTYTTAGTFDCNEYLSDNFYNPKYKFVDAFNPLVKWQFNKAKEKGLSASFTRNIYTKALIDRLMPIHNRMLQSKPDDYYLCNGCCTPGARKLYIKTNGDMLICERVGSSPIIGNISTGLDIDIVQKKYITEYIENSLPLCKNCWAVNLCKMCYAHCYSENGLNPQSKLEYCELMRKECRDDLIFYHQFMEEAPEAIKVIKEVVQK